MTDKRKACPDCPDGYLWTTRGPTTAECPTCKGKAWIAAPAPAAINIHDLANELDQLFRQKATMGDVEALLRRRLGVSHDNLHLSRELC